MSKLNAEQLDELREVWGHFNLLVNPTPGPPLLSNREAMDKLERLFVSLTGCDIETGNPCRICENTTTPQHTSGECGHCHGIDKIVVYWDNGTEDRFDTLTEAKEIILNAHAEGLAVDSVEGQDSEGETVCTYECTWSVQIDQQGPEVKLTDEQAAIIRANHEILKQAWNLPQEN